MTWHPYLSPLFIQMIFPLVHMLSAMMNYILGVQFTSEAQEVYSCIIPDENGVEQILHFGLYDYGYTSGEKASTTTTFIENCVPIPAALPLKPLSIKYISEDPFILSCESTIFPPFLVQWENNNGYHQESPSHLINRRNSINETILDIAANHSPENQGYTCFASVKVNYVSGDPALYEICESTNKRSFYPHPPASSLIVQTFIIILTTTISDAECFVLSIETSCI